MKPARIIALSALTFAAVAAVIALAVSALFWTPAGGHGAQAPAFTAAPSALGQTYTQSNGVRIIDVSPRPGCPAEFHCSGDRADYYITNGGETVVDVVRMYVTAYHINALFEPCVFDPNTNLQLHPADDQPLPAGIQVGFC